LYKLCQKHGTKLLSILLPDIDQFQSSSLMDSVDSLQQLDHQADVRRSIKLTNF